MRQDQRASFVAGLRRARETAYPAGEYVGQESFMRAAEIRRLARHAGIARGVSVLDLCCRIAGPGRLIVAELARRHATLTEQISELDMLLQPLVELANPRLLQVHGVGPQVATQLLTTAGDNPQRLHSDAAFAMPCGAAPLPASSGKTNRHRLNRGGDRQANNALWRVALCRMKTHPPTRAYVTRRTAEGLSRPETIRCLKRYIAREIYPILTGPAADPATSPA